MVRMSLPSAWFGAGAQSIFGLGPIFMLIPQPGVEGLTHLGKLSSYPKSIWSPGLWYPLIRNNCFVLLSLPRTQAETSINVCVVSLWQGWGRGRVLWCLVLKGTNPIIPRPFPNALI